MMKKAIAVVICIIMMLSVCACDMAVMQPDAVVDELLASIKNKDEEVLILYNDNRDINTLLHSTGDEEFLKSIYDGTVAGLSWEIISVKENKDQTKATVEVAVTNADMSDVLKDYQDKAVAYMTDNLYSDNFSKEKMTAECMDLFVAEIEKAVADEEGMVTETLSVELEKNEDHGWTILEPGDLIETAIGGLDFPKE